MQWTSNGKSKGKGNKKNGNKYLSWAFSEAAEFARRYDDKARAYYNRKLDKTNFMVAHASLAHKLARAAYSSCGTRLSSSRRRSSLGIGWSGEPALGLAKPSGLIGNRSTQ